MIHPTCSKCGAVFIGIEESVAVKTLQDIRQALEAWSRKPGEITLNDAMDTLREIAAAVRAAS